MDSMEIMDTAARQVASLVMQGENAWVPDAEDGQGAGLYEVRADGAASILAAMNPYMVLENAIYALQRKDPRLAQALQATIDAMPEDDETFESNVESNVLTMPMAQAA